MTPIRNAIWLEFLMYLHADLPGVSFKQPHKYEHMTLGIEGYVRGV